MPAKQIIKHIEALFSWKKIQSSHRLMTLIVLLLGGLNFLWGEKVPAGGGLGWDGIFYAEMVRHLDSMISGGQLSNYYAQRILPSSVVRAMLLVFKVTTSDTAIIRGFELYNLALLVVACRVWKRIANIFSLSLSGRWIGFGAIFINYQCSKQAFYYPVLTDVTALCVAMLLLLFYVEKRPIALCVVTIIGAFSWPVVSVCGALLLIFMDTALPTEVIEPAQQSAHLKPSKLTHFAKLGALLVLILSVVGCLVLAHARPSGVAASSLEKLLTALPSLDVMMIAIAMLIGSGAFFQAVAANLWKTRLFSFVLAIAALLVPFCLVKTLSNPDVANASSLMNLIRITLLPQEGKFLLPFVTLAVFWGPVVLLLLLYWKAFCIEARKLGSGVVAILGISLLLGLVGEPRFLTIGWPFFVAGLVLAMESSNKKASFKYAMLTLTVLYAQFWMEFNLAPWPGNDYEGLQEFPKQVYFMHYGLWMNWWAYSIQFALLVLSAIWLRGTIIHVGRVGDDNP